MLIATAYLSASLVATLAICGACALSGRADKVILVNMRKLALQNELVELAQNLQRTDSRYVRSG
jgi:hypothetical protein